MDIDWEQVFKCIEVALKGSLPSVSSLAAGNQDPFKVLVSTVISLRTKDEVTLAVSQRLFSLAPNPEALFALDQTELEKLLFPAGFYRVKAANLHKIAQILVDSHGGKVPSDLQALLALPGVGRKTANLTLNLGFGIDAICVDTHVHRISNRTGWVKTKRPQQTEEALEKILPRPYWIPLNTMLVSFGQQICKPVSPLCSQCPLALMCRREGVTRSR